MAEHESEDEANVEDPIPETGRENIFGKALSDNQRRSVKDASKAVRRRLYFLFAMLALVIVLMNEAKKPEHWQWMGFDKQPSDEPIVLDPEQDLTSSLPIDDQSEQNGLANSPSRGPSSAAVSNVAKLHQQFIEQIWRASDTPRQTELIDLITRCAWSSGVQNPTSGGSDSLATTLQRFVTSQHNDVAISTMDQADQMAQRKVIDELARRWTEKLIPAFDSAANGKDITMAQQLAARESLGAFTQLAHEQLEDLTTVGRKSELPAWLLFWRRATSPAATDEMTTAVSTVELRAQPNAWRGKRVTIRGSLLAGRKVKLESNLALDQGHYFEWWIADRDGKGEIYCLYTSQHPDTVTAGEKLSSFDVPVEATGYFYKVRAYIDTQSQANYCPLILGKTLVPLAAAPASIINTTGLPSAWVMGLCLLGLAAFAFAIAMMVDRQDREKPLGPRGEMLESINENLAQLKEDSDIKTVAEKILELDDES